uniref:GDSL esterase/lipase n=1 Tax=Triticum urartu TaxID=4572 RepID=A0A8R7V8P6_TRIUA
MKGVFLLGAVVLALVGAVAGSTGVVRRAVVLAMFVLGDSTQDVGNNNHLPGKDVPRADKPFYGVDFPGGAIAPGGSATATTSPISSRGIWGSRGGLWLTWC